MCDDPCLWWLVVFVAYYLLYIYPSWQTTNLVQYFILSTSIFQTWNGWWFLRTKEMVLLKFIGSEFVFNETWIFHEKTTFIRNHFSYREYFIHSWAKNGSHFFFICCYMSFKVFQRNPHEVAGNAAYNLLGKREITLLFGSTLFVSVLLNFKQLSFMKISLHYIWMIFSNIYLKIQTIRLVCDLHEVLIRWRIAWDKYIV